MPLGWRSRLSRHHCASPVEASKRHMRAWSSAANNAPSAMVGAHLFCLSLAPLNSKRHQSGLPTSGGALPFMWGGRASWQSRVRPRSGRRKIDTTGHLPTLNCREPSQFQASYTTAMARRSACMPSSASAWSTSATADPRPMKSSSITVRGARSKRRPSIQRFRKWDLRWSRTIQIARSTPSCSKAANAVA